jgi:hypothetical protein
VHTRAVSEPDPESILRQLERVLASHQLARADTSRKLLSYLAECCLRNEVPKETAIALDVFGKDATFSGAEHSIVRVSVRTLRQKLIEYYAGPGEKDEIRFDIPKGGYKLVIARHTPAAARVVTDPETAAIPRRRGTIRAAMIAAGAILFTSLVVNLYLWTRIPTGTTDPSLALIRESPLWSDMAKSHRDLTIVLGDLFMYTQIDEVTGRMLTVRDPGINSNEELRVQLASDPRFAAGRGQRYATMLQKNVVLGMTTILSILDRQNRAIEVVACDDVTVDAIRKNDIIYIGPLVRLGPLAGHYELQSRYRYNNTPASITDVVTGKGYLPEGDLGEKHVDYALAAKFIGPTGNHILIITSGARNAGILQIVRTLTSPAGEAQIGARLRAKSIDPGGSFEALLTVTGFKRTDLTAAVVQVSALPNQITRSPIAATATLTP